MGRFERFNSMAKPGYLAFHRHAHSWILGALERGEQFDVAHQLIPMAMRYPSPVTGTGIPLVIGPVAGSLPTPEGLREEVRSAAWYTRLRGIDGLRRRHDPWLRHTYREADLVLGAAPYVAELAAETGARRVEVMDQIGLDELPPTVPLRHRPVGELRLLFVGRVIRTKGVRDSIRALAQLGDLPAVTLDVIGEGEDRAECEREATRLGVAVRVRFHGAQPHERVLEAYEQADAFMFPSFREPQGIVVVEAMSRGLPIIGAAYGGPMALVDESCALLVEPTEPRRFASDLADAIRSLANDPALSHRLRAAGRPRASSFLWEHKLAWLEDRYREVMSHHAACPEPVA